MSDVIIVGGGLAGLCCARHLQRHGIASQILEASDDVGGRVRTDSVEGFLLDRGFQVLLTAYPEAQRMLDYRRLALRPFFAGALVRRAGGFARLADPFRHPVAAIGMLDGAIGGIADGLRVLKVRARAGSGTVNALFARPEQSTLDYLRGAGFSSAMIDAFFRPFLGGVFLERDLATSSRMFEFVFRMFAEGDTAVPAAGMGAIAHQLAGSLATGSVRLGARAVSVGPQSVTLESGEVVSGRAVVVATEHHAAAHLLHEPVPSSHGVACVYYAAPEPPTSEPILVLNGEDDGPVNNVAVISNVAPSYAPPGVALVSVSIVGQFALDDEALDGAVRRQLGGWWGSQVGAWRHLRTYRIAQALPVRSGGALSPVALPATHPSGVFLAGDHRDSPSIQGAMVAGRRAADAVVAALAGR